MDPRLRFFWGVVLALVTPGLGRVFAGYRYWGNIVVGFTLFLLYQMSLWVHLQTWWIHWPIRFTVWAWFASIDVKAVERIVYSNNENG